MTITNRSHYKRFIFDLDDCISHCIDRDWENARADYDMVNKINQLYDDGWEIWIVTARGQLSCNGDLQAREAKYRLQIEDWLRSNGVHYHNLSFEKVLGAYYVDDKALPIKDFLSTDFRISRGLSGGEVYITDDKIVSKTCDNALTVAQWYERATDLQYCVPKVYSIIGKTLNLEFIKGNQYKPGTVINKVIDTAISFGQYKPLSSGDFSTYIERVHNHLLISEIDTHVQTEILKRFKAIEEYCNSTKSFCHGDYSIDNMIFTNRDIYLFDPNPTEYSSWLLDVSKLAHSLRRFNLDDDLEQLYSRFDDHTKSIISILEASHWLRILKYVKGKNDALYSRALNEITEWVMT